MAAVTQIITMPDGTKADRPRNEPRVKLRVKARVDTLLPGGHLVSRGNEEEPQWCEVVAYVSDFKRILEMVEDRQDALKHAEEAVETQYKTWLIEKVNETAYEDEKRGKVNPKYNRKTWGGSLERVFQQQVGVRRLGTGDDRRIVSGIKPLLEVEKVEDLPVPEQPRPLGMDGATLALGGVSLESLIQERVDAAVAEALAKAKGRKG